MEKIRVGFAICGSFCTFHQVMPQVKKLVDAGYDVIPIMSEFSYSTDTRFGRAQEFIDYLKTVTQKEIIHTIDQAEPIGPQKLLDILVIAPCTGNTVSKLANAITDTSVTMAAKAQLRNARPVVIAVSSNDALSGSAGNLGRLMSMRNIYFVPMGHDDSVHKPSSMVADFEQIQPVIESALKGIQAEPIMIER